MKKVLITGVTSFIGFSVMKELYNRGIDIIAVVRSSSKNMDKLQGYRIKIIECDLESIKTIEDKILGEKIDIIYHFAWQGVYGKECRNEKIQLMNLHATLDLIDVADRLDIPTFIGAGSIHETEAIYEMSENRIIKNRGLMYKSAKLAAHYMGKAKCGYTGIRFFWPIITNAYGEGEISDRLISSAIRKLLCGSTLNVSEGEQLYDFIYIDDVANAFYLIGKKGIDGRNYIIGSGHPQPLYKYLKIVERFVNDMVSYPQYIRLGFGKKTQYVINLPESSFETRTLTEDTGFYPRTSFEKGIIKTIQWTEKNIKK